MTKKVPGIVLGLVDADGIRIVSCGKSGALPDRPLDGDTVFEIGSITKVFTGILLADMVERGEVKLDDPVAAYLPKTVKVPSRGGKQITLADLGTQSSGLPRLPNNLAPRDAANPYADYTVERLYAFLGSYQLGRDIGAEYEYSNLGFGLLGHALALKAGTNYEGLVTARILKPLGMTDTAIVLSPALKTRLAPGHSAGGAQVKNWDIPTFAGAGALRSTANDMLKFLAANLGLTNTPLTAAMRRSHQGRHSAGSPAMDIGLAWHILKRFDPPIIWHNGGTGGYHSFIGFDTRARRGVVVLANSANSIDDLGFHALQAKFPLEGSK